MSRLAATILMLAFLLPAVLFSLAGASDAWAQANRTDLMQQSDHRRRAARHAKPEPVRQQTAGVIPLETDAGDGDYVVMAILAGSLVITAFGATRAKKIRFRR